MTTHHTFALPPVIEAEYQRATKREKCSREDFYYGFIAALNWTRDLLHPTDVLADEFDREFREDAA